MEIKVGTPAVVFHLPRLLVLARSKTVAAMPGSQDAASPHVKLPSLSPETFEIYVQILLQGEAIAWDKHAARDYQRQWTTAIGVYLLAIDLKDSRTANNIMDKLGLLIKRDWPHVHQIQDLYELCPEATRQLRQLIIDDIISHGDEDDLRELLDKGGAALWEFSRDLNVAQMAAKEQDEEDHHGSATYHVKDF